MNIVPDVAIVFEYEGTRRLEYRQVPFAAWRQVKQQAGFTPATLLDGMEKFDLDALAALIYLDRSQSDRRATFGTTVQDMSKSDSEFEIVDVISDGKSLMDEDADEGDEVDPTTSGS